MSMEKIGIEVESAATPGEKTGGLKCSHPLDYIKEDIVDGQEIKFCTKCEKYLRG